VGWLEHVALPEAGLRLVAKLDTGAKSSAIDAEDVEPFERDGARWVRFTTRGGKRGGRARLEGRVVGEARVRSSLGRQSRVEVELSACVAGGRRNLTFTLARRQGLNYPVLLGREAMVGWLAVDPSRTFTVEPGCDVR
jgi:hypothetical protein